MEILLDRKDGLPASSTISVFRLFSTILFLIGGLPIFSVPLLSPTLRPLDLDGYLLEKWKSGKARQVRSRLAADFQAWEDETIFEEQLGRVVKALRADEGARPTAPKL